MIPNLDLGHTRLILTECQAAGLLRNQAAYALATAWHETAHTMEPVEEAYYLGRQAEAYRKKLRYYPWHGRGFVQLTWQRNYVLAGQKLDVDMTTDPDVAMEPGIAAKVMALGMRDGWFTGKKLADYITLSRSDFVGARRIINGTDKAHSIAGYADTYDRALKADGYGETDAPGDPLSPREALALLRALPMPPDTAAAVAAILNRVPA